MKSKCITFDELSLIELYQIMNLRQEVFIVEQDCPYLDADNKDQKAYHLLIQDNDELIAYTRILPPGISYENYSSIGRVVNKKKLRNTGLGKKLMMESIVICKRLFPDYSIKISAQKYLEEFYKSLGFNPTGAYYLEDNIPHMGMIYR